MSNTNHKKQDWTTVAAFCSVLGLAERELIFSTAALTVLSFALVARKVQLTHHCFGYIWIAVAQPQCCLPRFPPTTTKGLSKILWEDKKCHPKLTKEIFHTSVIEPKKWERKGSIHYNVCLWEQPPCILKLCFPGSGWTLLADALCSYTCKLLL